MSTTAISQQARQMSTNGNRDTLVVSSFDLEPNPFEQSFASSKKGGPKEVGDGAITVGLAAGGATVDGASEVPGSVVKASPVPLLSVKPPTMQSPPVLTPGGSRRLPPLLLSPNVLQNGAAAHQTSAGAPTLPHSGVTPLLSVPGNGTSTPGFFLNLSKTGLTPNESNIRTGLTPGILTNGATGVGTADSAPPPIPLPTGHFTPGLSTLLGLPLPDKHSSPAAVLEPTAPPIGNSVSGSVTASASSTTVNSGTSNTPLEMQAPPRKMVHSGSGSGGTTAASSNGSDSTPSGARLNEDNSNLEPAQKRRKPAPKKSKKNEPAQEIKDEQERKRKEFLERNRVAASKFRKRKKEYIKKIESDVQFYEAEYDDLSQCMDKLCGISKQTINSSLVGMLKQALLRHDVNSALTLCNHVEQVLLQTKYVQRSGRNPRREDEEKRRRDSLNENNSDSHVMQQQLHHHSETANYSGGAQQMKNNGHAEGDDATGTINNLPLVINGNTLLSLDDIHHGSARKNGASNLIADNTPVSRHSSLTNLEQQGQPSAVLHDYPNSN
ncbi:LAFE_0H03928g1_1 [Lachancea fermentati]|uniref:LAFE_0H03928g1_1 n=1 Tax=Lachancea fermentati TaxID=4955 RepID=A0A1G4MJE9_LACFM|nr:LAFE_0H03928g1_1 [Lachancea fermentati]